MNLQLNTSIKNFGRWGRIAIAGTVLRPDTMPCTPLHKSVRAN
jgi:hypothetical protein